MASALHFTTVALRMLSGLLIWGAHFGFVYVFTALACARQFHHLNWLGIGIVPWMAVLAAVAALAAILPLMLPVWRRFRQRTAEGSAAFLDGVTLALGGLSVLAIIWETLPVFLVPICG